MALNETERLLLCQAIEEAERGSPGEVRLHIERSCPGGDALARARHWFGQLGMHKTRSDTGVLLYVAEADRRAAVYAGAGIYRLAGPARWLEVSGAVAGGYATGQPFVGLKRALDLIGETLRTHCGAADAHGDELPNRVTTS